MTVVTADTTVLSDLLRACRVDNAFAWLDDDVGNADIGRRITKTGRCEVRTAVYFVDCKRFGGAREVERCSSGVVGISEPDECDVVGLVLRQWHTEKLTVAVWQMQNLRSRKIR